MCGEYVRLDDIQNQIAYYNYIRLPNVRFSLSKPWPLEKHQGQEADRPW